jgi:septal ring factor EnvC (AmiA/AmiB activator)
MPQQISIKEDEQPDLAESFKSKSQWEFFLSQDRETQKFILNFHKELNELKNQVNIIKEQHKEIRQAINEIKENNKKMDQSINRMNALLSDSNQLEEKNISPIKNMNFLDAFINWLVSCINKQFELIRSHSFFSGNGIDNLGADRTNTGCCEFYTNSKP